ncbi:MAG TPA: DUF2207 domain-containing protein, partial [Thermoplasmatales archaeon]|nr:DUF2207 domain-containing protein [Thermoplasmatales archaeon]
MREEWYIVMVAAVAVALAAGGYAALELYKYGGNLYVAEYEVHFSPNGTLSETYTYQVKSGDTYRMLYRFWDAPLTYQEELDEPYIEVTDIECPYTPYIKDYAGRVYASHSQLFIQSVAFRNEVGCLNSEYYSPGAYVIRYDYRLYPPVLTDGRHYHMNIQLARSHIPYHHVTMIVDNSSGAIVALYTHPPMDIRREGTQYVISGKSRRNGLLELEMVLSSFSPKFSYHEEGILEKTVDTNTAYRTRYEVVDFLAALFKTLAFCFPPIVAAIYYVHGREKRYTIPRYLSYVPKKRKPWKVNLVFKGGATDFDMNGFYATLLDLQRRGIISITPEGKEISIRIIAPEAPLDSYERKVMKFLKKYATDGIFSTEEMKRRIHHHRGDVAALTGMKRDFDGLTSVRGGMRFIVNGRIFMAKVFALSLIPMTVLAISYMLWHASYPLLLDSLVFSLIFSMQFLVAIAAPPRVFGRWKREYFREKMEWMSFRRFLLDMA